MFELDPWLCVTIFALTAFMDALHTIYTRAVAREKPAVAATFGSVIYLVSGYTVLQYTKNPAYLGIVVLGSWVGTYASIRASMYLTQRKTVREASQTLS